MAKARVTRAALLGILVSMFGGTWGFLATSLNASDPDLVHILCPDQTTGITRDHKWITREAIRRNLRQFFIDFPPPDVPEFKVSESASLTELYHAYYGDAASPARFMKAVNTIAASNVHADSSKTSRYDPILQADAEIFVDYQYAMSDRYPQIITSIVADEEYPAARSLLGVTLHSLQKFYAHSTWIEQGNTNIASELGLPGFPGFDDPAEPEEDVCTPCPNAQGECKDNVIKGAGLTTGYYTYSEVEAEEYLVLKPSTGGKCSHGGVLDDSTDDPAIGGINKDTASPCFSPHYYLHDQAAELAVQATHHYLSVILNAVNVDSYRGLFDLYHGSALSIVIDTTSSMGSVISAVKDQVHQIVESGSAGLYVLVPFNDPEVGPVTRTKDPKEFLDAVDALRAHGGGDLPEMFWGGLQLALTNTPEYGAIFCFTDAVGKDGEKMEGDIAMAQQKNTKVTLIFSGSQRVDKQDNSDKTNMADYYNLCDISGGLFIPSEKFNIGEITPLLDDTVESTEVDIILLKEIDTIRDIEIPIDDAIFDFKVQVVGDPASCVLSDTIGTEYDLLDEEAMRHTPGVEVIAYTDTIRAIRWQEPSFGIWNLRTEGKKETVSVTVQGNSTLSWLGGFSILDPSPPHPHYMAVEGRPLTDTIYYVDIYLIGYLESNVRDVDHIEFLSISGEVLRTIEYNGDIDDEFYIRTEPLPNQRFYMVLYGHLESGNVFCRLMSVMILPVQASVEVASTSEELSARPGETAVGKFIVNNYGLESDFTITGNDDKEYMTKITPTVHIAHNSSAIVTADFSVPPTAATGTVSIVTVTAKSIKQTQSVNSAVTQFVVLPPEDDHDKPLCDVEEPPSCEGYAYAGVCHTKNWTVSATMKDIGSGMNNVYAKPAGLSTAVDKFVPGSKEPIGIQYEASCCLLATDIIGVDIVGNVGTCAIDMGVLGGLIFDFEVIDVGTTWVYLKWSLTPTVYDVHKYTLKLNDDYTWEFPCRTEVCLRNVTDLESCLYQDFKLIPVFTIEGNDYAGGPAYTDTTTLSVDPGSPVNGKVEEVSANAATISWIPQQNQCISKFQVCVKPVGFEDPISCDITEETTYAIKNLEGCAVYNVEVTAIDLEGDLSKESLTIEVTTQEGLPGKPVDLVVEITGYDTATLTWYDPAENTLCIRNYIVTSNAHDASVSKEVPQNLGVNITPKKHYFRETDLSACTNFTFTVNTVTLSDQKGPYAMQDAVTGEIDEPIQVETLSIEKVTTASMDVAWSSNSTCVDHYRLCYYNNYEAIENCEDLMDTQRSLGDLLECADYHVSVSTVTPSGHVGEKTTKTAKTIDVAPGEPANLKIVEQTPHTIKIQYEEPTLNPQCAVHYGYDIAKKTSMETQMKPMTSKLLNGIQENTFEDLDACTDYDIRVNAASLEGSSSEWVKTQGTTGIEATSEARGFSVESKTTTTMTLSWFEPGTNGKCVNKYTIDWDGGMQEVGPPAPGAHLPYQVEVKLTELAPCTDYNFDLTPVTANDIKGPVTSLVAKTEC